MHPIQTNHGASIKQSDYNVCSAATGMAVVIQYRDQSALYMCIIAAD